MTSNSAIGSQIRFLYQTNYPTFTPAQVNKMLKEKDYTIGQGRYVDPQSPNMPQLSVPMFSKDNLNIHINPALNQLGFMILNTISLDEVYEEITTILSSLNIISEVISGISFLFITRYKVEHPPRTQMTTLLKNEFVEGLSSVLGEAISLSSINLTTSVSSEKGLTIVFEPLISSPGDNYFININYNTKDWDEFQTFIDKFRDGMLKQIFDEVEKIA